MSKYIVMQLSPEFLKDGIMIEMGDIGEQPEITSYCDLLCLFTGINI